MLQAMEFRKVRAVKDVLTADNKAKRIVWCQEKKQELAHDPRLFDEWLIIDEMRILLDGNKVLRWEQLIRWLKFEKGKTFIKRTFKSNRQSSAEA